LQPGEPHEPDLTAFAHVSQRAQLRRCRRLSPPSVRRCRKRATVKLAEPMTNGLLHRHLFTAVCPMTLDRADFSTVFSRVEMMNCT